MKVREADRIAVQNTAIQARVAVVVVCVECALADHDIRDASLDEWDNLGDADVAWQGGRCDRPPQRRGG